MTVRVAAFLLALALPLHAALFDWPTENRALLEGRPDPEMSGALAVETLQLCFAVYQASMDRGAVDPSTITDSVTPPWWPPTIEHIMRTAGLAAPGE